MTARLLSFVVWALVAASAAFWGQRFMAQPMPMPAQTMAVGPAQMVAGSLVRLFGAAPVAEAPAAAPVVADARFKLLGVVAPRAGERSGWALIAVDDRPARAFPLGGRVDDQLVVQTISHRQVELGPKGAPPAVSLNLSPLAEAARGVPPSAGGAPKPQIQLQPPSPTFAPPGRAGRLSGAATHFPPAPPPTVVADPGAQTGPSPHGGPLPGPAESGGMAPKQR